MALSWQYIAGFFDGEGSVRMQMGSRAISIHIGIHQSGERGLALLKEMQTFLALHRINSGIQRQRDIPGTGKPMFRLYIYNIAAALKFMDAVYPYIHIKKLECQDLSRFVRMFPPFYAWLSLKMSKVGCEICGGERKINRSRTCGSTKCKGILIWKVRHGQVPRGRYLPIRGKLVA